MPIRIEPNNIFLKIETHSYIEDEKLHIYQFETSK
jgi:hypothetical protein